MKEHYGSKAKLCYIDTDSFINCINFCNILKMTQRKGLENEFMKLIELYQQKKTGKSYWYGEGQTGWRKNDRICCFNIINVYLQEKIITKEKNLKKPQQMGNKK